ncbi:MAG: hypothetical protein ACYS80_04750, partial [Planctomycetota bacterium]
LGYSDWGGYFLGKGHFSGNVGIGTETPEAKLDVESSSSSLTGMHVGNTALGTSASLAGSFYAVYGDSGAEAGIWDFYAAGGVSEYGPFTGAHEVKLANNSPLDIEPGMIVSVTGQTQVRQDEDGVVAISSTLPTVRLSDAANDKAVFGVLVSESPLPKEHWYQANETERFATVNALFVP